MTAEKSKIIYTLTDEAPLLATASLLPVIQTFAKAADIDVVTSDNISPIHRCIAAIIRARRICTPIMFFYHHNILWS